jgi:hypothetical protein
MQEPSPGNTVALGALLANLDESFSFNEILKRTT